jgi:hypothetical protein
VRLALTGLFDGAHDERDRLVSAVGEGICGAERLSGAWNPDDDLRCAADVERPVENTDRAR